MDERGGPARWLRDRRAGSRPLAAKRPLGVGLRMAVSADIIRPSLRWLVAAKGSKSALAASFARARDTEGFAHLRALCEESAVTASAVLTARAPLRRAHRRGQGGLRPRHHGR